MAQSPTPTPPAETEVSDPFANFAPAPEPVPGRGVRLLGELRRLARHEWTLAALGSVLLALAMTWPTMRQPTRTLPEDTVDPALQAWQMAWSGHALITNPLQLWHGNGFYPERYSYAFSDTLLGYAPAGLIGAGPEAAILRYNIMYVLVHALACFGAYALVRQLGSGRIGGAVAGISFAYAPWRLAQAGHLHVLSTGGIALALAMLARGHGWSLRYGYRPQRHRPGWVLAGWLVAAWQLSLGFGIGLGFAYVLALVCFVGVAGWVLRAAARGRAATPFGWRMLAANAGGGLVFGAVGALMAIPYFTVAELHPYARRTADLLSAYSPPLRGYVTAPASSLLWGDAHAGLRSTLSWPPEMTMLPGFALYALAATGLFYSVWSLRQRLLLLVGVLAFGGLSMGTQFVGGGQFGYLLLFHYLPGWDGVRTPGRMMLWATLLLGILAAGGVSEVLRHAALLRPRAVRLGLGRWLRVASVVPVLMVAAEGLNHTPHPTVPPPPLALGTYPGPTLLLPSDFTTDSHALLWSTTGFPRMVNGNSGFTPASQAEARQASQTFPDAASVAYLKSKGVRTVIVLNDLVAGTPWQKAPVAPVEGLGVTRVDVGNTVVFQIS